MVNVKTAISLQESLFEQAEALAEELRISRSRLFSLALEEFIHRFHNQQFLMRLNTANEDVDEDQEQILRRRMRRHHRRMVIERKGRCAVSPASAGNS